MLRGRPLRSAQSSRPAADPAGTRRRAAARATILTIVLAIAALLLGASANAETSILDPHGAQAAPIAGLGWIMFGLSAVVFVVVMGFLLAAVLRARRRGEAEGEMGEANTRPILIGTALTAAIMIVLAGLGFWTLGGLASSNAAAMTVEVNGHQYWWEVRYPGQEIVTANEIHIPVGQPVAIRLMSDDVIHSFWVPELAGKLDLIPGRANELRIEASVPGVYLGECAEFCGIQHALMRFRVVAESPDAFAAWVAHESQNAAVSPPDSLVERGEEVFLGSACVYCHAVRGTAAASDFGPDLTHLASRKTLAAGVLDNNAGNLAAWIVDPQAIKPGNLMPGFNYDADELQALLAYLESLH
jgi:cytochrome c oxidase subunit 2